MAAKLRPILTESEVPAVESARDIDAGLLQPTGEGNVGNRGMSAERRAALPTNLVELDSALRQLLVEDVPARPFVCSGSPFNCEVAIVGINPATTTSFWDHWSATEGFNRSAWISAYDANPANRHKATRPRIERLVCGIAPVRVIELNAFPYATANERALGKAWRDPQVFELMLQVAMPRLVFVFGKSPAQVLCDLIQIPVPDRGSPTTCAFKGNPFTLLYESHLSRGWSYERVRSLSARMKGLVSLPPASPL